VPAPLTEGQVIVEHLSFLEAFAATGHEQQAGILESARETASTAPTAENRLRYALLLAYPGGPHHDPLAAVSELQAILDDSGQLQPSEQALVRLLLADASTRAMFLQKAAETSSQAARSEKEREQAFNRKVQAQAAEIDRLKQALEEAEAKLKAVAELEKSLTERPSLPKGPPP